MRYDLPPRLARAVVVYVNVLGVAVCVVGRFSPLTAPLAVPQNRRRAVLVLDYAISLSRFAPLVKAFFKNFLDFF